MAHRVINFFLVVALMLVLACREEKKLTLHEILEGKQSLVGKADYLNTPFVTAGDRLYMVGHQNGDFPDLGWHITGEMGGIWDHPIKLMDGFSIGINTGEEYWCLDKASRFVNYPYANRHEFILGEELKVSRLQVVPDGLEGLLIELKIENTSYITKDLKIDFTGFTDLRPTWLAERQNVVDGADDVSWNAAANAFVAKDGLNPWFVAFSSSDNDQLSIGIDSQCDLKNSGNGTKAMFSKEVQLQPGEFRTLVFSISGSSRSEAEALLTLKTLQENANQLVIQKMDRYEVIASRSEIQIPDKSIQQMYEWVKYDTDWLIRDVEGEGRGLSAGIPDYPWWFGADNCYALQGLLAAGGHEEVRATMDLILRLSKKGNEKGRIMHETSTNGEVYNPGNLNETPHFIYLLWKAYEWTGDKDFLSDVYPAVKNGLKWISEDQDQDGNGYPDGPGMMEIQGLHSEMIDVVVYTQQAFEAAAKIANELGDKVNAQLYQVQADNLREKIDQEWWVESAASFADFRSGKWEAYQLIEEAIVRADTIKKPWTVEELTALKEKLLKNPLTTTKGHVVHHNWVVNTPMEMGLAEPEKAIAALNTAAQFTNQFGVYVTGIDRDESQAEKWKSFSYVGAVMTLPTGVQAIAEARYGRPEKSLAYLQMLRQSFGYALPGSMYEVSPDYGMIAQAWNIYAVAVPLVEYFFGVKPNAPEKLTVFEPQMPVAWENVSIKNVRVGENAVGYKRERLQDRIRYTLTQTLSDWTIELRIKDKEVLLNGTPRNTEETTLRFTGIENVVEILD